MQLNYPYAINVDWLQIFCHDSNVGFLSNLYYDISVYDFKLLPHSSRHFKEIWEVIDEDGEKYAIIQRTPHSGIISKDGAIIQLCNRELYKPHYAANFLLFLSTHGFSYKSVSRLDVCFDSNYLRNKFRHSNLIKGLMDGTILKNNQSRVQWNFSAVANVGKPMECNSCSFGSKSSGVSTKMYNKTLEMKEQKSKPYIIENWGYNGIDTESDVWRIEISIKSDASTTIRTETGEIFRLSADALKLQCMVEDIFFSYARRYFSFKKNNGKKNKTRMPDLEIFPKDRILTLHPVRITNERDSSRSDRIFLKKLMGLTKEFSKMDAQTWEALVEVINAFTLSRNLSSWAEAKFEVKKLYQSWANIKRESLSREISDLVQKLLNDNPQKTESIFELSTILSKILLKQEL